MEGDRGSAKHGAVGLRGVCISDVLLMRRYCVGERNSD